MLTRCARYARSGTRCVLPLARFRWAGDVMAYQPKHARPVTGTPPEELPVILRGLADLVKVVEGS